MENISSQIVFGFIILVVAALVALIVIMSRIRAARARRVRAQLFRSLRAHPSFPRPAQERTRHLDLAGFDWTSDKL